MRIAFLEPINWDYTVESVYQRPLGGSQSALCYLSEALSLQGHDVFLLNNSSKSKLSCGVMHFPLTTAPHQLLRSLDALVIWNTAGIGQQIKPILNEKTCLVLWVGIAYYQPAMAALQTYAEQDIYDGMVFVSEWQRNDFYQNFHLTPASTCIIRNAAGSKFHELFADDTPILPQKSQPPVIAYTSAPDRGLALLLDIFPRICQLVPGTRLKVFSSMKLYQISEADDYIENGKLYRQCQETPGVEYIGSLSQPELARELQSINLLAYPNTVPETSCIAVMEAMASGCWVVTSNWGGLPETTAGFANLITPEGDWEAYKERFLEATVQVLQECMKTDSRATEAHLKRQIEYVHCEYNWSIQAQKWIDWLSSIGATNTLTNSLSSLELATIKSTDWQLLAYQCLMQNEYAQAAAFYEQAIQVCPVIMSNYWYLGLTLLLQGKEEEAQTTWMLAMINGESEQVNLWTELLQVLQAEVNRRNTLADYPTVQLIEQYINNMIANYS